MSIIPEKYSMRRIGVGALVAALIALASSCASAQARTESFAIESAAADYLASHFPKGRILFDTTGVGPSSVPSPGGRTVSENLALAAKLGALQIGRAADFRSCPHLHTAQCEIVGFDAAILMSEPVIDGQSAYVKIRRFFRVRADGPQMSRFDYQVHLTKANGIWAIDRFVATSVS